MLDEVPQRVAVLLVMALTMGVTAYCRLRAASSGERITYAAEGYLFATVLRLAGLTLWLATLAYLIYPPAVRWAALPVPGAIRWTAAAVGAACALLMAWTLGSLGKNLTDTVVTRADARLVTEGPYRWVRHPFYVVAGLLMAAVTVLSANALIGAASLVVLGLLALRTPKEEQFLIERFGDEYREYMARTGRYFPRLFGTRPE